MTGTSSVLGKNPMWRIHSGKWGGKVVEKVKKAEINKN